MELFAKNCAVLNVSSRGFINGKISVGFTVPPDTDVNSAAAQEECNYFRSLLAEQIRNDVSIVLSHPLVLDRT